MFFSRTPVALRQTSTDSRAGIHIPGTSPSAGSVFPLICAILASLPLSAQLSPDPGAIPHTSKPPVVFLNGFEFDCGSATFQTAFGIADQVLQSNGRVSLFFNTCSVPGRPSMETLGAAFGSYLARLRYVDGQAVNMVDVVAYSMGGLVFRSYLEGKQETQQMFSPPQAVPIGKAIFIGTPHFGTPVASLAFGANVETDELSSGSHFLIDLNTWNQNREDLRGIDAIAIAGNGGTGIATTPGFDDGLVPLSSASLGFYGAGRTRILPRCHVSSPGLLTQFGFCPPNSVGIAKISAASDETARIIVSFLNGTADWQSIGVAPEQDRFLQNGGALWVRARTADDTKIEPSSVRIAPAAGTAKDLNMSNNEIAYTDLTAAGTVGVTVNAAGQSFTEAVNLPPGGARPFILKPGPRVSAVTPAPTAVFPLVLAPRMIVSIYGSGMDQSTVMLNGAAIPALYVSDQQINAILPEDAPLGLSRMTVRNATGSETINVFIEAAFPMVFALDRTGSAAGVNAANGMIVSPTNPLHAGDYVELFLTGLGRTTARNDLGYAQLQPTVTIGGMNCPVTYAGAAPGIPGLDQINCIVPAGLGPRTAPVVVTTGARSSAVTTLNLQ